VFISKTKDYEIGSNIFHHNYYVNETSVWEENSILDSIEEQKVGKSLREIVKKRFKNHYQFNYSKKKWEVCNIFSTKQ
jgi:hypothetical protein